ncbi:CKLF-like MARVEL transmembrane domain-containing protein 3 isoform X2 [Eretmochelys imbricata]
MMAPLIEFLLALFLFFAYSSKLNEKFKGIYWPLTDFLRCVTAAIIYFAISIAAVSKYSDGASKAAGVFGFIATIVFAVDFYITFNDLVTFLKQGGSENATEAQKSEGPALGFSCPKQKICRSESATAQAKKGWPGCHPWNCATPSTCLLRWCREPVLSPQLLSLELLFFVLDLSETNSWAGLCPSFEAPQPFAMMRPPIRIRTEEQRTYGL